MKIQKIALSFVWVLTIQIHAHADAFLSHTSGNVQVSVSDFGSLGAIRDGSLTSNFRFPKTEDIHYLQGQSEIWIGDLNGNVANVWEFTDRFLLGEWATTQSGAINKVVETDGREIITSQYSSTRNSDFPLNLLVDQQSFSWSTNNYPDADDFIVIKLIITNNSNNHLSNIYVAMMTNWDVDETDPAAGQLSRDWVDWDESRQSLLTYDGDDTDGINPAHMGLSLLDGKLSVQQIVPFFDPSGQIFSSIFVDSNRSVLMAPPTFFASSQQDIEGLGFPPWDYVSIISAGPYDIRAKKFITVTFALVGGENLLDLQRNIDAARRISFAPQGLKAEVTPDGVTLKWEASINPSVVGYALLRRTAEEQNFQQLKIVGGISSDDTEIDRYGVEHIYKLRPVDINGRPFEFDSPEVRIIPNLMPDAPEGLTATLSGDRVTLNWKKSTEPIAGYIINRNHTGESPWTPIASVPLENTSFVDINVYPGFKYFYAINATNQFDGRSNFSASVSIVIPEETSVTTALDLGNVVVVPNPYRRSADANHLEFRNLTRHATIRIYDSIGNLIKLIDRTKEGHVEHWDGRNDEGELISPGVYVYHVEAPKAAGRGKISSSGKFAVVR
jgi:hypothetical protein